MKKLPILLLVLLWCATPLHAQRADLSGLKFCIDPGHGGHNPATDRYVVPDPGTDFWESESNFQKAMRLDTLLRARGAWVILTRYTNDYPTDDEPSLTARWQLANANNVNWFHSIHSNASGLASNTSVNYTLVLVKEVISTRQPAFPEDVTMGNLVGPSIQSKLRDQPRSTWTYLDYTFYGGTSGGYNLGVLSGLTMPGELSEGSFHDYFPETRRLMNNLYLKMEAYAIRNAFMQYFGVPADTLGIIAGIQSDLATSKNINLSRVRLLPVNRVVTGDSYNNGFYMFDSLPAGTYTMRFETPGYSPDSIQVILGRGATTFVDRSLVAQANPTVLLTSPVNNDTTVVVTQPVVITFSKPMDTASVRTAFSVTPSVAGTLQWGNANSQLTFTPAAYLDAAVAYQVRIDTAARSASGQSFDGNGDGTGGDPFVLKFTTKYFDVFPPVIAASFPGSLVQLPAPTPVVNMTFNEPLNQTTVNASNFVIQQVGGSQQARTLEYQEANGKGGVTMYLPSGIVAGNSYRVRVSRVADLLGNTLPTTTSYVWDFSVAPGIYSTTVIDSANPGTTGCIAPTAPADRLGVDSLTVGATSARGVGSVAGNPGSLNVSCSWDTTQSVTSLRIPLDTASAGGHLRFRKSGTVLRAYVYGDAGNAQVCFVVNDSVDAFPSGPPARTEQSRWVSIDWVGWRALHWDLEADTAGTGTGNGQLEGLMRFAGMKFRYVPAVSKRTLQLSIDQIEVIQRGTTGVADGPQEMPLAFALYPAYPNPFNPSTTIGFTIPGAGSVRGATNSEFRYQNSEIGIPGSSWVRLSIYDILGREVATLVDGVQVPGHHSVTWEPGGSRGGAATGVYIARLIVRSANGDLLYTATQQLLMIK